SSAPRRAIEDITRVIDRRSQPADRERVGCADVRQVRGVLADRVIVSTPLDPFLSLRALADYSGLSVRKLRDYLELAPQDALPCYRVVGKILVRRSDFDAWMGRYYSRGRPSLARAIRELGLDTSIRIEVLSPRGQASRQNGEGENHDHPAR